MKKNEEDWTGLDQSESDCFLKFFLSFTFSNCNLHFICLISDYYMIPDPLQKCYPVVGHCSPPHFGDRQETGNSCAI